MKNLKLQAKDAKREILPDLDLVKPETSLAHIFDVFKFHTVTRALFVVNGEGKLVGTLDIRTLLKIFAASLVKQESLTFFSEVSARSAENVMIHPVFVRESDTLEKALQVMVESKTEDLAVVDADGKVTGSLNCFDVLGKLAG